MYIHLAAQMVVVVCVCVFARACVCIVSVCIGSEGAHEKINVYPKKILTYMLIYIYIYIYVYIYIYIGSNGADKQVLAVCCQPSGVLLVVCC